LKEKYKFFDVGDILIVKETGEILLVVKIFIDAFPLYALETKNDIKYAGMFFISRECEKIGEI